MLKKKILLLLTLLLLFALVLPVSADDSLPPVDDSPEEDVGDDVGDDVDMETIDYCAEDATAQQPVAWRLVMMYDSEEHPLTYEEVMAWYCEGGYGFGQIKLALQTARAGEWVVSPADLLAAKTELGGWGLVWKEYGFKKVKPDKDMPPGLAKKLNQDSDDEIVDEGSDSQGPPPWANNDKKDKDKDKDKDK